MAGLFQPTTPDGVAAAAEKHGPAPGAKTLLQAEKEAAEYAVASGLYTVFRSTSKQHPDFCTRVAPSAKCFCGHSLQEHSELRLRACGNCKCKSFRYIPFRPEEVGEFWLPRRKGFNVHTWRAKCRCKCGSDVHDPAPPYRCSSCSCGGFQSDFLCVVCDLHWEEHATVTETEQERRDQRFAIGADFVPFADSPQLFDAVFRPRLANPLQPKHSKKPERSVRLMPVNCGGRGEGKPARPSLEEELRPVSKPLPRRAAAALLPSGNGAAVSRLNRSRGGGRDGINSTGGGREGIMAGLQAPDVDSIAGGVVSARQRLGTGGSVGGRGREGSGPTGARAPEVGGQRRAGGGGWGGAGSARGGSRGEGEGNTRGGGVGEGGRGGYREWGRGGGGGAEGWGGERGGIGGMGGGGGGGGGAAGGGGGGGGLQGIYGGLFEGERMAAGHSSGADMMDRLREASKGRR